MNALQKLNEDMICLMKKNPSVLGAWEFGSGMHHTRDQYSDIDIVFLVQESEYNNMDQQLPDILENVCDHVLIFWAEDFNGPSLRNYDCLLERDGEILQYDIFLLNAAAIDDEMCKIHYADLQTENIYFDRDGTVAALIDPNRARYTWQDDILRLIDTYWLHVYMTAKYFMRKDYFKLEGVLRILMDTHASLLLTIYDRTTWGGTANKLHYLPQEKQNHLKYYFCDNDLEQTKKNLWQSMLWFEEDVHQLNPSEATEKYNHIANQIKNHWKGLLPC